MKTLIEKTQTAGARAPQPSRWRGKSEQLSFIQLGCEARKMSTAAAGVFFLDFPWELARGLDLNQRPPGYKLDEALSRLCLSMTYIDVGTAYSILF